MKKLFTLIILAAATLTVKAADFELYFNGEVAENGGSYVSGYDFEEITMIDPKTGEEITRDRYFQDARLAVKGPAGAAVQLTVTSNQTQVQVCSLDGQCDYLSTANGYSLTKSGAFTGQMQNLEIDKETVVKPGANSKMKDITVDVTVTSGTTSKHVTVNMSNTIAGVDNVSTDAAEFVKLAGRTLNYNAASSTTLEVYTITGARMMSTRINGHGSVSLQSLPKGIYLYRMGRINGKVIIR